MTTLQLEQQKEVLETRIIPVQQRAIAFQIQSPEDRALIKRYSVEVDEILEVMEKELGLTQKKGNAKKVHSDLCDLEKKFYGPLWNAQDIYKKKANVYDTEQSLKAQREADRLEAERRDKEEKERQKLEKKAEKELEKGNTAKAEQLLEEAENVQIAPSFNPAPAATKKLKTKVKNVNVFKLCRLIAEGVIPFNCVEVNESKLNAWANDQDPKAEFDGLELFQESAGRI